jgi:hypothetical protein
MTLSDSIKLLGDGPWDQVSAMRDSVCLSQLMDKADDKIRTYLKIVWCGEHNEDFWSWFYDNEPKLAQRAEVSQDHEAIGQWVERWLKLPHWHLVEFLHEFHPSFLETGKHVSHKRGNRAGQAQPGHYPTQAAG